MSWLAKLERAAAERAMCNADPLRAKVAATVHGTDAISTAALLDLIGLRANTANARRVAKTMRSLGYIPIKSRRLLPGGWQGTVIRGWARPVRQSPTTSKQIGTSRVATPMQGGMEAQP